MRLMGWLYRSAPTGISLLLTPFLLLLGVWSAGAGHGNFALVVFLFPFPIFFGFLITPFFTCPEFGDCFPRDTLVFAIAIVQFPIYGLLFSLLWKRAIYLAILLAIIHLAFFAAFWTHFGSFGFN
jgi:hypothetical protein